MHRQWWMEWLTKTLNCWMVYKTVTSYYLFWVILQVYNLVLSSKHCGFLLVWLSTCSGCSCSRWPRPECPALWPLPLDKSRAAKWPRWAMSVPDSCRHSSYVPRAAPEPCTLDARSPWYIRFASLSSHRHPCFACSWANHDTSSEHSRTPVGCLQNVIKVTKFWSTIQLANVVCEKIRNSYSIVVRYQEWKRCCFVYTL